MQRQLISHFNADPACVNESRVFRLPGFFHCKEEPIMVECIKFNPELRYTQQELSDVLPQIPEEDVFIKTPAAIVGSGTQKGLMVVGRKCQFIQHCKRNAKTLSEPDWYAMISNLALFDGGEVVIHKLSKPYPNYNQDKTTAKINHFISSGTKPMTCKRIAEHGFVCPKLKSCPCRSPAGFAFRPLKLDELRKLLNSTKKTNNPVDDSQLANLFVEHYLYNVEPSLAEPFITYEIRNFFALKSDDVKRILKQYNYIYKEYMESEGAQKSTTSSLPDWYEHTKSGGLRFMPAILANHLSESVDAFYTAEQYYFYSGGVYNPREDKDAKKMVRTFLNPRDATLNQINDVEGQWQLVIRKEILEINANPFIINTSNGLYNVVTDTFSPHTPKYFSTVQMKASYNPEAKCERFIEFLNSILAQPEIDLLQEIFGYFLVPITKAQKSFLLVGLPNVGKSTILSVLQEFLLGRENVSNIAWHKLSDRFTPAELFGKLANIFADLSNKSIDDAGNFKAATGEDYITGERTHRDPFSFKPFARFLFSCNTIPRNLGDNSEGFYRRLIIIPFTRPVPDDKRDLSLKDKLSVERDGILLWAIQGLKRVIKHNYVFAETDVTNTEMTKYKSENSSVLAFVYDACVLGSGVECLKEEAYSAYKIFCDENTMKPAGYKRFAKEIDSLDDAREYLNSQLLKLNEKCNIEEEKKHLLPYLPKLELAEISKNDVNSYSFIRVDNNFYSVPEYLVGKSVTVKSYYDEICVYSNDIRVCSHKRLEGTNGMKVDIEHY